MPEEMKPDPLLGNLIPEVFSLIIEMMFWETTRDFARKTRRQALERAIAKMEGVDYVLSCMRQNNRNWGMDLSLRVNNEINKFRRFLNIATDEMLDNLFEEVLTEVRGKQNGC